MVASLAIIPIVAAIGCSASMLAQQNVSAARVKV
jgi:hypothetical protein